GAGFSGLYTLHRLRKLGFSARVLERGSGLGGTWFWNRYPGARCDIESVDYCYSFSEELLDEWRWSERYPAQPEILSYLDHVADRFDLRREIQLETEVTRMEFDEDASRWLVDTEQGERFACRWCVMAVGNLSSVKRPSFAGRSVAVIGTGSTGIQAIPQIAAQAEQLYVFQRTPNYSMPAQNRPLEP